MQYSRLFLGRSLAALFAVALFGVGVVGCDGVIGDPPQPRQEPASRAQVVPKHDLLLTEVVAALPPDVRIVALEALQNGDRVVEVALAPPSRDALEITSQFSAAVEPILTHLEASLSKSLLRAPPEVKQSIEDELTKIATLRASEPDPAKLRLRSLVVDGPPAQIEAFKQAIGGSAGGDPR